MIEWRKKKNDVLPVLLNWNAEKFATACWCRSADCLIVRAVGRRRRRRMIDSSLKKNGVSQGELPDCERIRRCSVSRRR